MLNSLLTSPATGDMAGVVGIVLAVAAVAIVVVLVISKKKGD
ncbi:MAG: NPXTG-anchored protein [Clostridia bacterium]|nr:NPXTG-anchored protein [Clostridia bacterium]